MASYDVANLKLDQAPHTAARIGAMRKAALVFAFTSGALAMFAAQRFNAQGQVHADSARPAPVRGAPVSAAPVSTAPVSAAPVSAAPVSTAPVSTAPVSTAPSSRVLVPQEVEKPAERPAVDAHTHDDDSKTASAANLPTETGRVAVPGVTEPAPGRFVSLPLATSQPVAFVDVKPGDQVQKGWQVFSHWESPERLLAVKNELERAKKMLEIAQVRCTAAEQTLARIEKLAGTVTPQELQDSQTTAAIRQAEVEAAELTLSEVQNRFTAMDFEFKQAFVTSPIEGVVASVDVVQGERRQFSSAFRGVTVLDPRVLVCRCLLTGEQAAALKRASQAGDEIANIVFDGRDWPAKLLSIGVMAEGSTGRIPVLLEIQNPEQTLFSGVPVTVRFSRPFEAPP